MNNKHEALWPSKNYKFYTLCTLVLSNPLHLIIGSRLILTQNELWVHKCYHANFKVFSLCLGHPNDAMNFFVYYVLWYSLYITFFGQKWFIFSVLWPQIIMWRPVEIRNWTWTNSNCSKNHENKSWQNAQDLWRCKKCLKGN
jgi:hypothetical protein